MYEEFLKEKLMIDEIVRKIYEEDQQAMMLRLEKQRATQEYIRDFIRKREEWKEHERQLMEEENRRILEFSHQQQAREDERMADLREKEEAKARVQAQLADSIAAKQEAEEEMDRCVGDREAGWGVSLVVRIYKLCTYTMSHACFFIMVP